MSYNEIFFGFLDGSYTESKLIVLFGYLCEGVPVCLETDREGKWDIKALNMEPRPFNFEQDLKDDIYKVLSSSGIKISSCGSLDDMLIDYLTIRAKIISRIERKVYCSPVLQKKLRTHSKKKEIGHIALMLTQGKNVNIFQSKNLHQSKFHDHLLYEWNIFHFHLSTKKEKKSNFVKQVNELLFAYVDDEKAIFLDVAKHTPGIFGDTKWLEILHDYYPKVIEPYRDKSISDVHPKINAVERQTLWDKGYTLGMTKIRDKVYFSPGIGRTTTGHSTIVIKTANEIHRWLHLINMQFSSNYNRISEYLKLSQNEIEFKLRLGEVTLEIVEAQSKQIILTYPEVVKENL